MVMVHKQMHAWAVAEHQLVETEINWMCLFIGTAYTSTTNEDILSLGYEYTCNGFEEKLLDCSLHPITFCNLYAEIECTAGILII